ncbi:hypothetical protein Tco_0200128 [Tanacetum coccineum]
MQLPSIVIYALCKRNQRKGRGSVRGSIALGARRLGKFSYLEAYQYAGSSCNAPTEPLSSEKVNDSIPGIVLMFKT